MHVSDIGSTHKLANQYIDVAKSHFGMEVVNDIQDFDTAGSNRIARLPNGSIHTTEHAVTLQKPLFIL